MREKNLHDQIRNVDGYTWEAVVLRKKLYPNAGRREKPRRPCFGPIEFKTQSHISKGFVQNLSASGMFIEARGSFFMDEEIHLRFSLPFIRNPITIDGQIRRMTSKGIGIQFILSNMDQEKRLQHFQDKSIEVFGLNSAFACPWVLMD